MKRETIAPDTFYVRRGKRWIDFVLSLAGLVLLSPVLLTAGVLVRINLGKPVIFFQERPGRGEKLFKLYKFRSMTDKKDKNGELLPDEKRLTRFGRILRETSLDELPELVNILKGDMSIVGPRPLAEEYLPFYTEEERHRHDVLPGLTGLAQINGRNAISWEKKIFYDVTYVRQLSLKKDLEIMKKTILYVLERKHIGQGEEAPVSLHIERQQYEEGNRK